jgi:hypothetical protein
MRCVRSADPESSGCDARKNSSTLEAQQLAHFTAPSKTTQFSFCAPARLICMERMACAYCTDCYDAQLLLICNINRNALNEHADQID